MLLTQEISGLGCGSLESQTRLKKYLWRACSEALPTLVNLQRREILDEICSQCGQAQEDTQHAIWGYEKVHEIWNPMFDGVRQDYLGTSTFTDLVNLIGRQPKNLELFAAVAWYIWTQRNKLKHNEKFMQPQTILSTASILFSDFQNRNLASPTNHRSRQTRDDKWANWVINGLSV